MQIADHVGFKYNIELVPDNNYGALNLSTGQWNGLVRVGKEFWKGTVPWEILGFYHRRRKKTEEKAKVVAAFWGTELNKFLAALTIWHQDDLKKGMNSSCSSYRTGAGHPILQIFLVKRASNCTNWINSAPQTEATTFAFSSVLFLLLWFFYLVLFRKPRFMKSFFTSQNCDNFAKKISVWDVK